MTDCRLVARMWDAESKSGALTTFTAEVCCAVVDLAKKVCLEPAGELATTALLTHLKEQRVTSMEDLKFMQLDWLVSALQPAGLSPLLLNKFLTLAKDGQSP